MKKPKNINLLDCFYVLDGQKPRHPVDLEEWERLFEIQHRRVAETETELYRVSTVFLGVAHGSHRDGPPDLFETMVFTSPEYAAIVPREESMDHKTIRYVSWSDAEAGHATQVRRLERQIDLLTKATAKNREENRKADAEGPQKD